VQRVSRRTAFTTKDVGDALLSGGQFAGDGIGIARIDTSTVMASTPRRIRRSSISESSTVPAASSVFPSRSVTALASVMPGAIRPGERHSARVFIHSSSWRFGVIPVNAREFATAMGR
jgi:hypothetical protein